MTVAGAMVLDSAQRMRRIPAPGLFTLKEMT